MRRRITAYLLAALTVWSSGCATAINMQEATMRKPYGGFTMPLGDFFGGTEAGEYVVERFFPLWLLDKPLSLFGDTITLPYTLWVQRESRLSQKKPTGAMPPAGTYISPSTISSSQRDRSSP